MSAKKIIREVRENVLASKRKLALSLSKYELFLISLFLDCPEKDPNRRIATIMFVRLINARAITNLWMCGYIGKLDSIGWRRWISTIFHI